MANSQRTLRARRLKRSKELDWFDRLLRICDLAIRLCLFYERT
jgi:hypothetical protein